MTGVQTCALPIFNKFSQCDNTHAREVYGWQPQVDIETGLGRVIEAETRMLAGLEK